MKNKNKFSLLALLFIALTLTSIESCKKYEDGPAISLRSRSARLSNTWRVENYKVNGDDLTSLVSGYSETFSKSGDYSYSWGILNGSGNWTFQNKDEQVKLSGNDGQSSRMLFIRKLEEKTLWYYYFEGNDKYELHLVEK